MSPQKLWWAAIKPPMYSVAVMPIWVGSAIAYAQTGQFKIGVFALFLLSAILILAWENLSNDVFDSETGVDVNKFNSVVNITGKKSLIFWISNACKGLGEILCFFAFGPLAMSASYYSQTQTYSQTNLLASVIVGVITSLILFCSHFNQVKDDAAIGKRSPVVQLGSERSAKLLRWICGSVYAAIGIGAMTQVFPPLVLLSYFSIPAANRLCKLVLNNYDQPQKLIFCRLVAVEMHFWCGLLFGLGFLLR